MTAVARLLIALALVMPVAGDGASATAVPEGTNEWFVADGRDLQRALSVARGGETILLEPGRTYQGPFVLPARPASRTPAWVTLRTRGAVVSPRRASRRVGPADAPRMARLTSPSGPVITAASGARYYRFVELEVAPEPGVFIHDLIDLGSHVDSLDDVPTGFVFERMYIHGDPDVGGRRGIALNSADTTITESYFSDFKERGNDSQAICGWNGPGPFVITNNYIEAAGENLMFGGADPRIGGLVPADIRIADNHFSKPTAWRHSGAWTVKNLLELKNARRVTIDRNVLEHSWTDGQTGFAVLFTPRNQDGAAPWSVVEDVTFQNNLVRRAGGGIHLLGTDNIQASRPLARVQVLNNLFLEIGGDRGAGRLFQIIDGTTDVMIAHNTAQHTGPAVLADERPHGGFVLRDNIFFHNEYGIIGSGASPGRDSIGRYFPDAIIEGNVMIGASAAAYPPNNFFPESVGVVRFENPAAGNYRLNGSSPFARSSAGRDPGANVDRVAGQAPHGSVGEAVPRGALMVFLVSAGLLVYVYAGYPLMLELAARIRTRPVRTSNRWPAISVVVVAHNEASRIVRRVENLLSLDYPELRREIVVASDGSTDNTAALVRAMSVPVKVVEFHQRRGKAAVFNAVLPALSGEIVVLADARQRFDGGALKALVADFSDPDVGAVTGELVLGGSGSGQEGSGLYWRYEKWIRACESRVDSCIGMTGAIAAIRRRLFEPLPEDTILDDVLIPLRIIRRGYRVTFEASAVAYDGYAASMADEFRRKVRTIAGNFQLFARERWLLDPRRNPLWIQTFSHKVLRLLIPVLLAGAAISNLFLLASPIFGITIGLQVMFYVAALMAALAPSLRRRIRGLAVPYTMCLLSWATIVAFVHFLQHRQTSAWERTTVNEPA